MISSSDDESSNSDDDRNWKRTSNKNERIEAKAPLSIEPYENNNLPSKTEEGSDNVANNDNTSVTNQISIISRPISSTTSNRNYQTLSNTVGLNSSFYQTKSTNSNNYQDYSSSSSSSSSYQTKSTTNSNFYQAYSSASSLTYSNNYQSTSFNKYSAPPPPIITYPPSSATSTYCNTYVPPPSIGFHTTRPPPVLHNTTRPPPQLTNTTVPPPQLSNTTVPPPQLSNTTVPPPQLSNTTVPPPQLSNTTVPPPQLSNTTIPPPQLSNTTVPPPKLSVTTVPPPIYSKYSQPPSSINAIGQYNNGINYPPPSSSSSSSLTNSIDLSKPPPVRSTENTSNDLIHKHKRSPPFHCFGRYTRSRSNSPKRSHRSRRSRSRSKSPPRRYRRSSRSRSKSRSRSPNVSSSIGRYDGNVMETLDTLRQVHEDEYRKYRSNPEHHPEHNEEKAKFFESCIRVRLEKGLDPQSDKISSEWKSLWAIKLDSLMEKSWRKKKKICLSLLNKSNRSSRESLKSSPRCRSKTPDRDYNYSYKGNNTPNSTRERSFSPPIRQKQISYSSQGTDYDNDKLKINSELSIDINDVEKLLKKMIDIPDVLGFLSQPIDLLYEKCVNSLKGEDVKSVLNTDAQMLFGMLKEKLTNHLKNEAPGHDQKCLIETILDQINEVESKFFESKDKKQNSDYKDFSEKKNSSVIERLDKSNEVNKVGIFSRLGLFQYDDVKEEEDEVLDCKLNSSENEDNSNLHENETSFSHDLLNIKGINDENRFEPILEEDSMGLIDDDAYSNVVDKILNDELEIPYFDQQISDDQINNPKHSNEGINLVDLTNSSPEYMSPGRKENKYTINEGKNKTEYFDLRKVLNNQSPKSQIDLQSNNSSPNSYNIGLDMQNSSTKSDSITDEFEEATICGHKPELIIQKFSCFQQLNDIEKDEMMNVLEVIKKTDSILAMTLQNFIDSSK